MEFLGAINILVHVAICWVVYSLYKKDRRSNYYFLICLSSVFMMFESIATLASCVYETICKAEPPFWLEYIEQTQLPLLGSIFLFIGFVLKYKQQNKINKEIENL